MAINIQEKVEMLKQFSVFKNIINSKLILIANKTSEITFSKGDIFIEQGEDDNNVYLIISGFVKVYITNDDGKEINIAMLGPNEAIGEIAPIVKEPRTAFCEAQSQVQALILKGDEFINIIKSDSEIALSLLKTFCKRLSDSIKHLEETTTLNLKDRTLVVLKNISKYSNDGIVNITQEELSEILSATRPRVSEALHKLVYSNKIVIENKKIKIL